MKQLPSVDEVRCRLDYDPATGIFRWKAPKSNVVKAGDVAGSRSNCGYIRISLGERPNLKQYLAHQLAWVHVYGYWPPCKLDHINGVRDDNRIGNLRIANDHENAHNTGKRRDNTSGFKGVSWDKSRKLWRANIRAYGVQRHLGRFPTREEAQRAYAEAASVLHGEFARVV